MPLYSSDWLARRASRRASGSAWKYAVYSGEKCSSPSLEYSIGRKPELRVNQSTRPLACSSRSAKTSAALWPDPITVTDPALSAASRSPRYAEECVSPLAHSGTHGTQPTPSTTCRARCSAPRVHTAHPPSTGRIASTRCEKRHDGSDDATQRQ